MKKIITIFIVFFALPASFAWGQDNAKLCEVYSDSYEGANQNIANIEAPGHSDDSAPRETNRQLQTLNERIVQMILIQQMEAHGCKIPKMISSGVGYIIEAQECYLERLKGSFDSEECDTNNWKSILQDLEHFK